LNTNAIAPNIRANININTCSGHVSGRVLASAHAEFKSVNTSPASIIFPVTGSMIAASCPH